MGQDSLEYAATKWSLPVLVCGECAKRTGPANQPTVLRKWLRKELARRGLKRSVRVVESSCLDVCPKRGVTVAVRGVQGAVVVGEPSQWPAVADLVESQIEIPSAR
jgi:predicted metal-binding protein